MQVNNFSAKSQSFKQEIMKKFFFSSPEMFIK